MKKRILILLLCGLAQLSWAQQRRMPRNINYLLATFEYQMHGDSVRVFLNSIQSADRETPLADNQGYIVIRETHVEEDLIQKVVLVEWGAGLGKKGNNVYLFSCKNNVLEQTDEIVTENPPLKLTEMDIPQVYIENIISVQMDEDTVLKLSKAICTGSPMEMPRRNRGRNQRNRINN